MDKLIPNYYNDITSIILDYCNFDIVNNKIKYICDNCHYKEERMYYLLNVILDINKIKIIFRDILYDYKTL